jgi:methyl-accepting chemotaxis protein
MSELAAVYRISETNLALRREFLGLTAADIRILRRLQPWSDRIADPLAREFYDRQFGFAPAREFFQRYADRHGTALQELRAGLEQTQAGYFRQIFAEAADGGAYGVAYFERRLRVGRMHNTINLPIKWYVGSYVLYFDLVRRRLRRSFPHRPRLRARAERAILAVMNADMQAVMEAFYFDTFAAMGVDLEAVAVDDPALDLSDRGADLKDRVRVPLRGITTALDALRAASAQMALSSDEAGKAVTEIAEAVTDVAQGADRQLQMINDAREHARQTAEVAGVALQASQAGIGAADHAAESMQAVRASSGSVSAVMDELEARSQEIGGIVETITGIAGQTNLLALNAAIEAARAGDQGRGFAVVAEEVRTLAEQAQESAERIALLITEIQGETANAVAAVGESVRQTEDGVDVVEQTRAAFASIAGQVKDIAGRVGQIVAATDEVAAVAESSSASAQQVSASTQQTSASSQEVASAAAGLAGTARELEAIVAGFKLDD